MNDENLLAALKRCRDARCDKCGNIGICGIQMRLNIRGALEMIERQDAEIQRLRLTLGIRNDLMEEGI